MLASLYPLPLKEHDRERRALAKHLDKPTLRSFVAGELPLRQSLKVAWHLYTCGGCRAEVEQMPCGAPLLNQLFVGVTSGSEADNYAEALQRSLSFFFERQSEMERHRLEAPLLYGELAKHPPARQHLLVVNSRRFHSWALCDLLLDRCEAAWFHAHHEAEGYAALALVIAESLVPETYSPRLLHDLKARCQVYIANSRRVNGDLVGAEEAFASAEAELAQGSEDPQEKAQLLRRKGSLHSAQRRMREAERAFLEAERLFLSAGDFHLAGKTLVSLANVHFIAGEPERALEVLERAHERIDPEREPALTLGLRHNLIDYLVEAGMAMQARAVWIKNRDLFERHADASLRRKALWLQGRLARGLGQLEQAEAWFLKARRAFDEQGLGFDQALVSLEMAELYAHQGRHDEVRQLANGLLPIFQALQLERETLAAVVLVVEAAQKQALTSTLLRQLASQLRLGLHAAPRTDT